MIWVICVAGGLLVVWLARRAIRFARGPIPGPVEADLFHPPIIIHLSMGDRLGDLPRSKEAISQALGRKRPVDEDIQAIIRQIEEQN